MEMPRECTRVIETQNEKGWIDVSIKKCPLYNVCKYRDTIRTNYKPINCPLVEIEETKTDVLDRIRAEIAEIEINGHIRDVECFNTGINVALNVIDKYKAESEE